MKTASLRPHNRLFKNKNIMMDDGTQSGHACNGHW